MNVNLSEVLKMCMKTITWITALSWVSLINWKFLIIALNPYFFLYKSWVLICFCVSKAVSVLSCTVWEVSSSCPNEFSLYILLFFIAKSPVLFCVHFFLEIPCQIPAVTTDTEYLHFFKNFFSYCSRYLVHDPLSPKYNVNHHLVSYYLWS